MDPGNSLFQTARSAMRGGAIAWRRMDWGPIECAENTPRTILGALEAGRSLQLPSRRLLASRMERVSPPACEVEEQG